ncbi:hypothetical protein AB5J62_24705 [Amycolatopsis sp. cg5]|uniref:hypothetical protein n=1 Tax=Amycolatopsis sp. cg5 TaxID=3238802 RepID=UPI003524A25F
MLGEIACEQAVKPLCRLETRAGNACKAVRRYSAPLDMYAPSCRQHMEKRVREAFDKDPLWSHIGQILWLLQRADQMDRPMMRTIEVANALRIHENRACEILNDLACIGRVIWIKKGRRTAWAIPGAKISLSRRAGYTIDRRLPWR